MQSYLINYGATVAFVVRVEIIDYSKDESWNIYIMYNENKVDMRWLDEDTVEVNGMKLNIHKDRYNWKDDEYYYTKS